MDNDARVQQLEQELQLLKAQIQSTLLDIQEQLLSNRYPALRLDEAKRPESDTDHGWKAPRPVPESLPEMEPVRITAVPSVVRLEVPPAAPTAPMTPVTPISPITPIAAVPSAGSTTFVAPVSPMTYAAPSAPAEPQAPRSQSLELPSRPMLTNEDWVALSRIAKWMTSKSAELGPQRMRALIKMYAQKQQLAPDVMENLLQFLALYGDEGVQVMTTMAGASTPSGNPSKVSALFGADALDLDAALGMDAPPNVGQIRRVHGHNTHAS